MGSVTPTVIPGEGYVRVEVNWQDIAHNRRAWIYRTVGGVDTKLRDGDYVWLSNGIAVAFDHEAPLDTPMTYKSTIPLNYSGDFESGVGDWIDTSSSGTVGTVTQSLDYYVPGTGNASARLVPSGASTSKAVSEFIPIAPDFINANPFFETNSTDWSGTNGATTGRSTLFFHTGIASLLITPDGVTSGPGAQTTAYPVVAGRTYGYSAWLRISSGAASRDVGIAWYDGSSVFLSSSVQTQSPAATVWALYSGSAVAPPGAAFARLISTGPGVLSAASTWRIDQAMLVDQTTQIQYTLAGRLLVSSAWAGGIGLQLQWYSDTTLIGSTGTLSDVTPFPGAWGAYGFTGVALPGADNVRVVFGITGSPPSTIPLYGDEIYLTRAASTVSSATAVIVPSNGAGWWTDPLHPATKVKLQIDLYGCANCADLAGVAYLGIGPDKTRPADGATFSVNDAAYPIGSFAVRKAPRSTMRVGTSTTADLAAVDALHASGAPLLLLMNTAYGEPAQYQLHGDLTEGRVNGDQRVSWRLVASDFAEVLAPVGPADGTLRTRYGDLTKYATYAAATSAAVTWLDALRGNLAP